MQKTLSKIFFCLLIFVISVFFASTVFAAYDKFSPGDPVTISEFVSKDDYSVFADDCTLSVYKPGGAPFTLTPFNASGTATMDKDTPDTGRRYKTFDTDGTVGVWPAIMSCSTPGQDDLTRLDKSFMVGYSNDLSADQKTGLAFSIWSYTGSALDTAGNAISKVWSYTGSALNTTGNAVSNTIAGVWSDVLSPNRLLTGKGLVTGNLVTETYLEDPNSSINVAIAANASQASLDLLPAATAVEVWKSALSDINVTNSIGKLLKDNIDAKTSSRSSHSAEDVWNVLSSALVLDNSIGKQLKTNVDTTISSRASPDDVAAALVALNNISAKDVWDYATVNATGTGSFGKLVKDNIDAQISAVPGASAVSVWGTVDKTISGITDPTLQAVADKVWGQSTRTLSSYGNDITAKDVWNVMSADLTTTDSIADLIKSNLDVKVSTRASLSNQEAGWTVNLSDFGQVSAGKVYSARLQILNYKSMPTDPAFAPVWTLYDSNHTEINPSNYVVVKDSNGIYRVSYTIPSDAVSGVSETVVSVEVESGKTIQVNDYWEVYQGSPAQVIINEITDKSIPEVSANVTIVNEGLNWYEYHYEWCVVTNSSDTCTGPGPVYGYGYASKELDGQEPYNTNLKAGDLPSTGNYYFRLKVHYGAEESDAIESFVATSAPSVVCGDNVCNGAETCSTCPGDCGKCSGTGAGGGGENIPPIIATCNGADFNHDHKVNSTDFSILLAFWKTTYPFKNSCVDVSGDKKVNSTDFSILMYQWGTKR